MPSHPTGLLIIRAWVEEGSAEPLRAQVRVTDDITKGVERRLTSAHSATVADLVDTWLEGILATAATDPAGDGSGRPLDAYDRTIEADGS